MTAPFLVTKSHKSIGIAILLTFLFGPIGLFYASVTGGLIMTFTPIFAALLLVAGLFQKNLLLLGWSFGFLLFFALTFWLINIIWAVSGVLSYNKEIDDDAKSNLDLWNSLHQKRHDQVVININQKSIDTDFSTQRTLEVSSPPPLQDWLKSNPGKTINDYFSKHGK